MELKKEKCCGCIIIENNKVKQAETENIFLKCEKNKRTSPKNVKNVNETSPKNVKSINRTSPRNVRKS